MKKGQRFVSVYREGSSVSYDGLKNVLVDRETGVNYLWVCSGHAGGLAPLLDRDGKVVVSQLPVEGK